MVPVTTKQFLKIQPDPKLSHGHASSCFGPKNMVQCCYEPRYTCEKIIDTNFLYHLFLTNFVMSVSSTKGQWYFPNAPYSWRSAHCFWPLSTPPTPPPWRLWRGTERGATVALAAKVFSGGVLQLATGKHHAMAIHLGGFLIIGIIYIT